MQQQSTRLLVVAAAGASEAAAPRLGERDACLVVERFTLPDLGFEALVLDPGRDAAEQLDAALAGRHGEIGAVLFYASSLVAVPEADECFLCLDPGQPDLGDALRDLAATLRDRVSGPLCAVIDARYPVGAHGPKEVLAAIVQSLHASETGIELVAAARPIGAHHERIPSRLTAALLEALDATSGPLTLSAAYRWLEEQRADFGSWPNAHLHAPGAQPFLLRRPTARSEPEADRGLAVQVRPSAIDLLPVVELGGEAGEVANVLLPPEPPPAAPTRPGYHAPEGEVPAVARAPVLIVPRDGWSEAADQGVRVRASSVDLAPIVALEPEPSAAAEAPDLDEAAQPEGAAVATADDGLSAEEEAAILAVVADEEKRREPPTPPAEEPLPAPSPRSSEPRRPPPESERREAYQAVPVPRSSRPLTDGLPSIIIGGGTPQAVEAERVARPTPADRPAARREAPTPVERPRLP
ncbi:MAG: hypothetical protein HY908_03275, partial [Myxococcales bacterium]|nr:hypothetical protein [Myxococcales bacterium]